jgi:hypothetical protein
VWWGDKEKDMWNGLRISQKLKTSSFYEHKSTPAGYSKRGNTPKLLAMYIGFRKKLHFSSEIQYGACFFFIFTQSLVFF